VTLALAGCNGSSTHAASSTPRSSHTGTLKLSRSWTSGSASANSVSKTEDQVTAAIECSTPAGGKICAAVTDFRSRFKSADARCLGRAPTGVRGVVDGTSVRLQVPIPGCLTGELRHDAQVIDLPSPM
jgi:hypothetical protein